MCRPLTNPVHTNQVNKMASEETRADAEDDNCIAELANDYAAYLHVDCPNEVLQFEESIEDMLTRLDEYCGLVDMVRSDTTLCMQTTLPQISEKSKEMHKVFEKIDRLEAFVATVKQNVSTMEELVTKSEDVVGSISSIKKVFKNISLPFFSSKKPPQPTEPSTPKFVAPRIFETEKFLLMKGRSSASVSTKHNAVVTDSFSESNLDMDNSYANDNNTGYLDPLMRKPCSASGQSESPVSNLDQLGALNRTDQPEEVSSVPKSQSEESIEKANQSENSSSGYSTEQVVEQNAEAL